jgi:hypothetical protein
MAASRPRTLLAHVLLRSVCTVADDLKKARINASINLLATSAFEPAFADFARRPEQTNEK